MLLLAPDQVTLTLPSTELDEHGWRLPGDPPPVWEGPGNLQLNAGISSPRAAEEGGRGPYGPARDNVGTLYLPPEAPVLEGSTVEVRGRRYVASQTHQVLDPVSAQLTCWAMTVTSVDTWPR